MQRLLLLAALALGAAFLLGRRRRQSAPAPVESALADELRSRLAESRAAEDAPPEEAPGPAGSDLDERRREVHETARRSLDELGT